MLDKKIKITKQKPIVSIYFECKRDKKSTSKSIVDAALNSLVATISTFFEDRKEDGCGAKSNNVIDELFSEQSPIMVEVVELGWVGGNDERGGRACWEWKKTTKGERVASGERDARREKIWREGDTPPKHKNKHKYVIKKFSNVRLCI